MLGSALSSYQNLGQQWRGSVTLLNADQAGQTFVPTPGRYEIAERYYANAMYERADAKESAIAAWYGLPRTLRPVLSLVKPAVDWWPATLFGGVWTSDGLPASDGQPNLLQYDRDTPDELRLAVQQAFSWANGGAEIPAWCRQGAMLGDGFGEIQVDFARRKAYPKFWHPRHITNIEWNDSGDVVEYTIEIPMVEPNGTRYRWGKTVDKETITTLYDGKPMGYDGQEAVTPNPYGFVPAVWWMFVNSGGQHGQSVVDGLYPVIDELQGIVGSIDDFIHKFIKQHVLIETSDTAGAKKKLEESQAKRGPTRDFANPNADRESMNTFAVPPGTRAHRLIDNIGLGEADPHVQRIMDNIDANLPELTIDKRIAEARQVTGPGGRFIAAPMQRRVNHSFGAIAAALVKLGQMACSINGFHLRNGDWGLSSQLTDQQRLFAPFRLESFDRGELGFGLVTPKLVQPTMAELAAEAKAVEGLGTAWGLGYVGLDDGQIYGTNPDGTAKTPPDLTEGETAGLLAEKSANQTSAAVAFGGLFDSGQG